MSTALGTALGIGVSKAAGLASRAIGSIFQLGWNRLSAIDDAKGKLKALGHDANNTAKILDSALASVKGTSYGLGEAATISASAVAAGIEPGKELTRYLKLVADTATVAGAPLEDIGLLFNQATTKGRVYTLQLNQLAQRGIPIYQWLAKELNVSQEALSGMVRKGLVDAETYRKAIENNIGGAATAATTVSSQWANTKAAMSRLGAAAIEPTFKRLVGWLGSTISGLDNATDAVKPFAQALDAKIFDEWGQKLKSAFAGFDGAGILATTKQVLSDIAAAGANVATPLGRIAGSLSQASAALGVGSWQLFLGTLEIVALTLNTIEPLISGLASVMESQQGIVTGLVGAWLLFKTIPALVGRVTGAMAPLTAAAGTAATAVGRIGTSTGRVADTARYGAIQMGRFGSTIQDMGRHVPTISRMQTAYLNTATAADRFGRTQGAAKGAMVGLKSAAGGLTGALGGPAGLAITMGMVGLLAFANRQQKAAQKAAEHKRRIDQLTESINLNTGALDANGVADMAKSLQDEGVLTAARKAGLDRQTVVKAAAGDKSAMGQFNIAKDARMIALLNQRGGVMDENSTKRDPNKDGEMLSYRDALKGFDDLAIAQAVYGDKTQLAKFEAQGLDGVIGSLRASLSAEQQELIKVNDAVGRNAGDTATAAKNQQELFETTGQAAKNLIALKDQLGSLPKGESVELDAKSIQGAEGMLKKLGFGIRQLPDGKVKVTAKTEEAAKALTRVAESIKATDFLKANPKVGLDGLVFAAGKRDIDKDLKDIDSTTVDPEVRGAFERWRDGKALTVQDLADLDKLSADPKIGAKLKEWLEAKEQVEKWQPPTKTQEVKVRVTNDYSAIESADSTGTAVGQRYRADGGIDVYAQGGIRAAEAYANGGYRLPDQATIEKADPKGGLVQWAEPSTGGEAFIPLANSKRKRSTSILATVAEMFGYSLVQDKGNTISGLVGNLAGNAVQLAIGKVTPFADGGIMSARALLAFASGQRVYGQQASQNLEGAPYRWGESNWGDCSGAMSALAAFALGLIPFPRKFSTSDEGAWLAANGARSGKGPGSAFNLAWWNGGPGGGHTLGTIAGVNVEMGGMRGNGQINGPDGADHPSATGHAWIPLGADVKITAADIYPNLFKSGGKGSNSSGGDQSQFGYDDGTVGDGTGDGTKSESTTYDYSQFEDDHERKVALQNDLKNARNDDERKVIQAAYDYAIQNKKPIEKDYPTTISGWGAFAASQLVGGQIASMLDVLGINDSPAFLTAGQEIYSKWDVARQKAARDQSKITGKQQSNSHTYTYGDESDTGVSKEELAQLKQDYDAEKLQREQKYDTDKQSVEDDYTLKKIDKATRDKKLLDLKQRYERDNQDAKTKYDKAVADAKNRVSKTTNSGLVLDVKQRYENEKLDRKQKYDQEVAARKQRYQNDRDAVAARKKNKEITADEAKAQNELLKTSYDHDLAGMKVRFQNAELKAKQTYENAAAAAKNQPTTIPTAPSGDGGATGNQVRDAFRAGLRTGWRAGQPWTDTDYIIGKESSWNPAARNPSSGAFGLPQFLGATKDKYLPSESTDPTVQGKAYDAYVGDRYGDPMKARAHWDANHWYDSGGIAGGIGQMVKNTLKPERVLSPRQTESFEQMVRSDFQSGVGTDQVVARLDRMIEMLAAVREKLGTERGGDTINLHSSDSESLMKAAEGHQKRRQLAALATW